MTEYSGMKFAMFFMAEYINMIGISVIFCAMFLGGYDDGFGFVSGAPLLGVPVLVAKVIVLLIFMVWIRGTVFRIRYDRLMTFGWKVLLPLSMVAVAWTAISIVIVEEGGSDIVYAVSAMVLFAIVFGVGYLLERSLGATTLPDPSDSEIVPTNRPLGALILQFVGGLLSIPIALYEATVGQLRKTVENAAVDDKK
jgi:hypothetical protein